MNNDQTPTYPLRDVARSPEATARYLADIQRVLLDIGGNLESLAREVRVHCRDTHVEGDRFYDAWLRAQPVERALKNVIRNVESVTKGLEKSAYKRRAHDEAVANTVRVRKEKELDRRRKKNPQLKAAPSPAERVSPGQSPGCSDVTSIYDLGKRESA